MCSVAGGSRAMKRRSDGFVAIERGGSCLGVEREWEQNFSVIMYQCIYANKSLNTDVSKAAPVNSNVRFHLMALWQFVIALVPTRWTIREKFDVTGLIGEHGVGHCLGVRRISPAEKCQKRACRITALSEFMAQRFNRVGK
jgi:hypothetical protein